MSNAQSNASRDDEDDATVNAIMSLVDIGDPSADLPESLAPDPLHRAFDLCVIAYRDVCAKNGLAKMLAMAKYGLIFTTFADYYQSSFKKDAIGQYAIVGKDRKLRPLNAHGRALFFQATSYRME